MPLSLLIGQYFPYFLLLAASLALLFHPVPGARAILFFTFGYFLTEAFYSMGWFAAYETRYHPLIIASFITIILYHSLDITVFLLAAWLLELTLIVLNINMLSGTLTAITHYRVTVILNLMEFLALLGNWWHGRNLVVYRKFIDLDIPIFCLSRQYRIVDKEAVD